MVGPNLKRFWSLWFVLVIVAGCAGPTPTPILEPELGAYWPTDGWYTSTPEQQGMDSETLARMFTAIHQRHYNIHSWTIVRHGYMVADAYVHPWTQDVKHNVYSCTKSIVSALIGVAIEEGLIGGVNEPILDLFPDRSVAYLDTDKRKMNLEHVLTMSAGLECRDSYLYNWRGLEQMRDSEDWVQFVLDLPMAEEPGSRFEYCNGASYLLSAIIQNATSMTALEYAQERLFGPLGIADVEWPSSSEGITIGYSQLHLRPHDMAKIGYLYLNGGQWNGQQVVPAAWVETSTRERISADTLQDGYGYQWWIDIAGTYMALGYGGQYILVVPEEDMVVVTTGMMTGEDFWIPERMLKEFIIPAVKSSSPLPPNPKGVVSLGSNIETLARP